MEIFSLVSFIVWGVISVSFSIYFVFKDLPTDKLDRIQVLSYMLLCPVLCAINGLNYLESI